MSEDNNINELSRHKAKRLVELFYGIFLDKGNAGFDECLIRLGKRGTDLLLLPNDVIFVMGLWYRFGYGHAPEDVVGDIKSAAFQYERADRYVDQMIDDYRKRIAEVLGD